MAEAEQKAGAAAEWRKYWYLPLVAGLGYTAPNLYAFALGPFVDALQQEFGWSRAQVMVGVAIANVPAIVLLPLVGLLIDRWGPRRVGLIGVCIMPAAFSLLGTATGSNANYWMIWAGIALCAPWVQGSIWTSATVSRFEAGRGMALAVTLSGSALSATVMPPLATWLIANLGWRDAFPALAGIWFLLMFIPIVFFFRGAQDQRRSSRADRAAASDLLPGLLLPEALRSPSFYKLLLAAFSFSFVVIGTVIHLVPILKGFGAAPMQAAGTAALIGAFSIIGRLSTGALLDRFRSNIVGACAYILPVPGYVALLVAGTDPTAQIFAVALFGLTMGAEVDVITYLITRHFGLRRFASVTSVMFSFIALGAALGPLVAGTSFDRFAGYAPYMMLAMAMAGISSLAVLSMRRPPFGGAAHPH